LPTSIGEHATYLGIAVDALMIVGLKGIRAGAANTLFWIILITSVRLRHAPER
jgi:hypothetical protein